MGIAPLPSEKRDGGSGSLRRRLRRMLKEDELDRYLVAKNAPIRPESKEAQKRRGTYQDIERMYENDCAPVKSPMMVFSAAEDLITHACQSGSCTVWRLSTTYPILINASRIVIESEARIEFNGIGVPNVVTCQESVW